MRPLRHILALLLLSALSLCSACTAGLSIGGPPAGYVPYTDYFLLGEDIYGLRGPDASDPEVYDAVIALLDGRGLFMGLYARGGYYGTERTVIRSGSISSRLMAYDGLGYYALAGSRGYGYLDAFGSFAEIDMDLSPVPSLLSAFDELRLEGRFDSYEAQGLIDAVSFIPFRDDVSAFTTPVSWRLSGYHDGDFFEVSFEQDLRAIAEYYTIRDY